VNHFLSSPKYGFRSKVLPSREIAAGMKAVLRRNAGIFHAAHALRSFPAVIAIRVCGFQAKTLTEG
jgi:phosphohistidine swiveling domain-containing protein